MAEIGQESVEFSTLVSRAAEESYLSLKELVEKSKSSDMSDSEKKISILKYLVKTQQRMLRLNVLAQWCQQVPLIQYCQQLASTLSSHETCFTQAADSMFFMHEGLQQARAPIYDVPSAIEVLLTGTYQRLPKCTEDVGIQSTLTDKQQKPVLKKLDTIVRSKLLETSLPKEFSEVKIFDGTVHLCVQGEFKVLLTLGYRGHLSMWRILHLEVLVGERSGLVKLEETRRFVLGDDLERRMAASDSPFATMYSILHEFCVALIMDTVIRQVQALRLGRWKDAIRFELISDGNPGQGSATGSVQMNQDGETDSGGLRTPGLKILYWLDCDKNNGTSDAVSCPFIKIEPGQDLRIKCLHSAFVIDPLTNKEAEFSIDQSCIDVEKLLLRAIWCNKFTRLLEIYKELGENSHIRRAAGDVLLHCPVDQPGAEYKADNKSDSEGQEVLRVRAYGSSFFTLGINIRTGRFLLHSSRSTIAPSALRECEEALNQGSITAAEAFISLRSKSFLHLFACIGRFLGLQVYEHGFSPVKVPKHILNGSNMLLMGFPDCGSSYFLLMQLEEDFRPLFKLLETQADPPGKPESSGVLNQVTRIKNVDVNQMHMLEDELNLSLLDYGALTLPANAVGTNQTSENGLSDLSVEGSGLLSAFSSIVDEVFEQERRSSAPAFPVQSFNTTFNTTTNHGSGPTISSSPKWEGGPQMSHIDNPAGSSWNGALYPTSNYKGRIPSVSTSSIAPAPGRSTVMKKLPASKSDQDLASRSPHSAEVGSYITMEEDQLGVAGSRSSRLSSLPQSSGPRVSAASARANAFRNSVTGTPDIQRLSNARTFALGMRKLLIIKSDEKTEESRSSSDAKAPPGAKSTSEAVDKYLEQMRRAFKIEAVGLMSLWFSFGSGVLARFVVEWESGKSGCTMHVSPDQLWPHTKFLEDFINGTEVSSLLDCIRLTAGPLHALAAATRPARAAPVSGVPGSASSVPTLSKASVYGQMPNNSNNVGHSSAPGGNPGASAISTLGTHGHHGSAMLTAASAAGRGGPGIVPSSLLPIDVSFVLRGPYWIRIIYRKYFAVDMRCFAGDQVWLQPATPPKGGPTVGGSLPCPQFRPFIMEHVAQELNGLDPNFTGGQQSVGPTNSNNSGAPSSPQVSASNGNRVSLAGPTGMSRPGNQPVGFSRATNAMPTSSTSSLGSSGLALRRPPGTVVPAHVRGELNTAIIGLGDDGGYGGGWVPLVALKKVLRGILKYLGVLWLFAQLPELLKEILGSILKDNEGALLNLDQEQPALRFFVGGYVFAVSVHRVQLLLQVLSVKRFHHSQQQQQNSVIAQEELSQSEIGEICDYFSRRVASEPYDASRVASFITLLTLPISVLREFLKLIAWKKGLVQTQGGDIPPAQRSRIELCLENHSGLYTDGNSDNSSVSKSNIHYDRPHNAVDFGLTVVLDPAHIPHINAAGGAAWLPYCVSVRLKYSFGDNPSVCFLGMEGSHGGRSCWLRLEDWEYCKQRVIRMVDMNGSSGGDANQGRLRMVADNVQRALHLCLQGLRTGGGGSSGGGGGVATGGNTT
ncbi:mediator of RNA polymerase II transcription subunit 14 isoform X2 [Cynara cardunculus var. scolymus]|uniref:mediator of RNA polymerase II transcription subunit 14 isoform X2 n=1 Tax=Cynara cardunculus var. scolymus TaxID=59895 RepID=UPI000D62B08D|nr:mediator of RNA polymerase II transcription subunit 14 isoform X2 [Cynara cardunculus var. scolymus]